MGNIHFYGHNLRVDTSFVVVSIPLNGKHPFLQHTENGNIIKKCCVSIPLNGKHPFLPCKQFQNCNKTIVSIPLNGKHPFLRNDSRGCSWRRIVSIPLNGKHPFLHRNALMHLRLKRQCVNSLKRETSISTVSSHKPLKSRLTGLIFAGNCLNILITSLYSSLLCFSKNCIHICTILLLNYGFILPYIIQIFNL